MSKKHELNIVINIDSININHGAGSNNGLLGFLAHLLANSVVTSSTNFTPSTGDATTPDTPIATADQPTPVQDTPQPQAPAVQKAKVDYTWPQVDDELSFFESAKNLHNDDTDSTAYPTVIEVTDDWFRVSGVFQRKTGKGTRSVTLKVSRAEVADGSVKYDIY
ncbi:MAG: hypothetical protein KGZ68_15150 [Dechloromonas sp.]|nr:hypothetical protein [Dechloromonas sp.]